MVFGIAEDDAAPETAAIVEGDFIDDGDHVISRDFERDDAVIVDEVISEIGSVDKVFIEPVCAAGFGVDP